MFAAMLIGLQGVGPSLPNGAFLHAPYLQIGEQTAVRNSLKLMFHTLPEDAKSKWTIRYQTANGMVSVEPQSNPILVATPPYTSFSADLNGLIPGSIFGYEVLKDGKEVFTSTGKAPRLGAKRWRMVALGDCGRGTPEQAKVAFEMNKSNADLCLITGDIVYDEGRASEYETKFWNYYNGPVSDRTKGTSMMRRVPFVPVPGNHDILNPDLTRYPDGLAYFYNFSVPQNGPKLSLDDPNSPRATGKNLENFLKTAGTNYPTIANYSFDYGNVHFLVLNSNPNVNWATSSLRDWIRNDLKQVKPDQWTIVSYHHPEFQSSLVHANDKQMRILSDLFAENKVDLVLTGHVHNYQRSRPIQESFKSLLSSSLNQNDWPFDRRFDGQRFLDTKGVIRIVTGGGGAPLYNPEIETDRSKWLPFTEKYIVKHSFSQIDFEDDILNFKQIDLDGNLIDQFKLRRKKK